MQELRLHDHHHSITNSHSRSSYGSGGGGGRDASPDSVIFSNFSLFSSSASASVERCSSASDVVDRDSIASAMSLHLSGRDFRDFSSSRGPDPDTNNNSTVFRSRGQHHISKKVEKAKYIIGYTDAVLDGEKNQTIDSARSSFSQAIKDCQYQKSRSEILQRKSDRRRPTSLDLNHQVINMTSSSPRLAMKSSVSNRRTSMCPSPVTPNYSPASSGIQKGWSSERVPLHTNTSRRQVNSALRSYNSGKILPSKWEDAERWISSPVAGDGALRPSVQQPQRRPKSKSGPLGARGPAYNSVYSPAVHMFDGVNVGSLFTDLPFSSRINAGDSLSIRYDQHDNCGNFPSLNEPCMARSVSVHGCSESLSESLLRITQDGRLGCVMDATNISRDVSRRDMATQMSPDCSPYSSPRRRSSNSIRLSASILPVEETGASKANVRDVQVDDQVSLSRWSTKTRTQIPGRRSASEMADEWKRKALEVRSAGWDVSEMSKSLSKVKREEAKITAWENLQKAKAEAAIRKLEMKLEKKRSSSMDKIINKLRSNQKKAQELRGSVLAKHTDHQVPTRSSSHKAISVIRTPHIGMGLFDRMKLSAKEDVTEHAEPLPLGSPPILEATSSFVVRAGETVSGLPEKRKGNTGEGTLSKKRVKTIVKRQGLGEPGLKPKGSPPAVAAAGVAGTSLAAAGGSSAEKLSCSSSASDSGSSGSGADSGRIKTVSDPSDDFAEATGLNPCEKFVPDWNLVNNSLLATPELSREYMYLARPPAESLRFENLSKRELSDFGCSAIVNGLLSFAEIHNRWLESSKEVREMKKRILRLTDENASLELRCESTEKEKKHLSETFDEAKKNLSLQVDANRHLNAELNDLKNSSSKRIADLEAMVSSLRSEREWIVSTGIGLAFQKIRNSDEYLDVLAEINSLSDKVGYNAGLLDGARLAAEGKRPEDAKNYDKNALKKLRHLSQQFDEASFPMIGSIAALASSDLDVIKTFLSSP